MKYKEFGKESYTCRIEWGTCKTCNVTYSFNMFYTAFSPSQDGRHSRRLYETDESDIQRIFQNNDWTDFQRWQNVCDAICDGTFNFQIFAGVENSVKKDLAPILNRLYYNRNIVHTYRINSISFITCLRSRARCYWAYCEQLLSFTTQKCDNVTMLIVREISVCLSSSCTYALKMFLLQK